MGVCVGICGGGRSLVDGGDDLDGIADVETEDLDGAHGAEKAGPGGAEEAVPVVGEHAAGQRELREVAGKRNVEGRGERDAVGNAERFERAARHAHAEERLVLVSTVEDDGVARGLARLEVGRFQVELGDVVVVVVAVAGATEEGERAAAGGVQVRDGVL